jgi:hypothetical protein
MKRTILLLAASVLLGFASHAQEPNTPGDVQQQIDALKAQMDKTLQEYEARIRALQAELDALKASVRPQGGAGEAELLPPLPAAPPAANEMNPALSVIPDFTFSAGDDPRWRAADPLQLRELELSFSARVDPYAQGFATVAFHKHAHSHELEGRFGHHEHEQEEEEHGWEVDVEEAYGLFPAVPGGFSVKLGKFYADFGKENAMHTHTWYQADRPLALQFLLGGHGHGLNDVGLSVNRILPLPWTSDVTLEVGGGRNEDLFSGQRSDLTYLLAWRNYWDFTENANLEAQISAMAGKNAWEGTTRLGNVSVTYRYKPVWSRRESIIWRTEYLYKDLRGRPEEEHAPLEKEISRGAFSYVDWQFARGWFLGARADWVEYPEDLGSDKGGALALTWFPSEYQKLRLQVERYSYAGLGMRNAVVLEYGFSLGPHGAHSF